MRTDLKVYVLRSALLALLPQNVLSNGLCTCRGRQMPPRPGTRLDLTLPERHFVVAPDAPFVVAPDAPFVVAPDAPFVVAPDAPF